MIGRPCRPREDVKALWRMLLPGTPFPACGMPSESDDGAEGGGNEPQSTAPANDSRGAAEVKSE